MAAVVGDRRIARPGRSSSCSGVNNVGRNQVVVARVADASGAHRPCRAGSRLARPAGGPARGRRDRRRRARVRSARQPSRRWIRSGWASPASASADRWPCWRRADPRIAERVRFVNAFGAFGDASTYLASVAANAYRDESGTEVPWTPVAAALARSTCASCSTRSPTPAIAERSTRPSAKTCWRPRDRHRTRQLRASLETDAARTIHDLLTAGSLADAERAIGALPADEPVIHRRDLADPPRGRARGGRVPHARHGGPPRTGRRVARRWHRHSRMPASCGRTPSSACSTTCSPTTSTSSPPPRSSSSSCSTCGRCWRSPSSGPR